MPSYETKALLKAIALAVLKAETAKEAYNTIAEIANAEGIVLKNYDEAMADNEANKSKT